MARWRSLHETAVVMLILKGADEETAIRYKVSFHIQAYKALIQYEKYQSRGGLDPVNPDDIESAKLLYEQVIRSYGPAMKNEYGWAANFIGKDAPTLFDLEEKIGLDHWRPRIRWASHYLHSGFKLPRTYLGMIESKQPGLLTGPSNAGFVDPGHQTAISLTVASVALLSLEPNEDNVIGMNFLSRFEEEIGARLMRGAERKAGSAD